MNYPLLDSIHDPTALRQLSETELDTAALADAIRNTGYEVGEIQKEPYRW